MKKNEMKKMVALATGTLAMGAISLNANASNLFESTDLGSGAELRGAILEMNGSSSAFIDNNDAELKCGEGKCGEGKCGEGKGKKEAKDATTKAKSDVAKEKTKATDKKEKAADKTKEGKCGEGKCGEGKCGTH